MDGVFNIYPRQNTTSVKLNDKINFNLNLINPLLISNQSKNNNSNSINKFLITFTLFLNIIHLITILTKS